MRMVKIVAFSLLFLGIETGRAEDPSVESEDAFQQLCETALDKLLYGDFRGADEFRKVLPEEKVRVLVYQFRKEFDEERVLRGEPIEWNFVGEKKVGNVFRKYFYVCRYENLPLLWKFTALNRAGRWSLASLNFSGKAQEVLEGVRSDSIDEEEEYLPLCNKIADLLAHRKREAFDLLDEHFLRPPADQPGASRRPDFEAMSYEYTSRGHILRFWECLKTGGE